LPGELSGYGAWPRSDAGHMSSQLMNRPTRPRCSAVALLETNIQRTLRVTNGKIYGEDGAAKLLGLKPTFLTSHIKAKNGYCNIEGSRRRRCRVVPLVAGDARPVCRPRCSAGR